VGSLGKTPVCAAAAGLLFITLGALGLAATAKGRPPRLEPERVSDPVSALAPHRPGELLIKFRERASSSDRALLRAELGARRLRRDRRGIEHLRLGPGLTTAEAVTRYRDSELVEYVEPNYVVHADLLPDDPRFPEMYGLRNTGQTGGTPGADVEAERAWGISTGSVEVLVAVIDTGIDYEHPDLSDNVWTNPGEIPGNGIDDDGNGFIDDVRGWDFINDDNDPFDDADHGTHVAGTIGAVGNNGTGVTGVSWKVSLVPLKFLGAEGSGSTFDAIAAIDYATMMGVDIANSSWGGGTFSHALLDAIEDAGDAGMLFVASAGNHGQNTDVAPQYPSSYDPPHVVSVAATNHLDSRAGFSNFGRVSVDLAAPGVDILSTLPFGVYGRKTGTSMAAPHVSGAAALVRAMRPKIDVLALKSLLLEGVDPVPTLSGITVSGGRLNAYRLIADADETPPGPIDDLIVESSTSNSVLLRWTATGDDGEEGTAAAYDLRYATQPTDEFSFASAVRVTGTSPPQSAGSVERMEVFGLDPDTTYYFAARAIDEWDNRGSLGSVVSGTTLPAPALASAPASFDLQLFTGQSAVLPLMITNAGRGTLDWSIAEPVVSGPGGILTAGVVTVAPTAGRLRTGESAAVSVQIDAAGLGSRSLESSIEVDSNDPERPSVAHPLFIQITGAPDVSVVGDPVTLESTRSFSVQGALTRHELPATVPPNGSARVELIAEGDFGVTNEQATLTVEGRVLGAVGGVGPDCRPASAAFELSASDIAALLEDGLLEVEVENAPVVGFFCERNLHTVRLHYRGPGGRIDFGTQFLGDSSDLSILIENRGTEPLHVGPIASSVVEFRPTVEYLTIEAGGSDVIAVDFAPERVGSHHGTLSVASDDPDTPLVELELSGIAEQPPVLEVSPAALTSTLFIGGREEQSLTLGNAGDHPLEFTVALEAMLDEAVAAGSEARTVASSPPAPSATAARSDPAALPGPATRFVELSPSPEPLGCVVEDADSASLFAQAHDGAAFYRYDAVADRWQRLADSSVPVSSRCGAALLQGRIYTAHTDNGATLGVFDIASNSWSTMPTPFGRTANIASDGERFLYLLEGTRLIRLDPRSSESQELAFPPFFFQPRGGLRELKGTLYAHQGLGGFGFAAYEPATDSWMPLPPLPEGAVLGAAIDPSHGEYFTYGSFGGQNLYRYFIGTGNWEVSTIPFFTVRDGGMGWLPEPRGIYLVQGGEGTGVARAVTAPRFVSVELRSGTLAPGSTLETPVILDARELPPDVYLASLAISSNDPTARRLELPVRLTVRGAPNVLLRGALREVESSDDYLFDGARTSHRLELHNPARGPAVFRLTADGDFGSGGETATLIAEGLSLGSVGETGSDCLPASGTFTVRSAEFAALAADGAVDVEVQNSPAVNARCSTNRHTLRLSYREAIDPLDFGASPVGGRRERSLVIENTGSEPLEIMEVTSDLPEFVAGVTAAVVPPGGVSNLELAFRPLQAGVFDGRLSVLSNDPDAPLTQVELRGTAVAPPQLGVDPAAIDLALYAGDRVQRNLELANAGGSPLTFDLEVSGASDAPAVTVELATGTIAPGETVNVPVEVDSRGAAAGSYTATLEITSDDPLQPLLVVPLSLTVLGAAHLELSGESIVVESLQGHSRQQTRTSHSLPILFTPAAGATLDLLAEGDFGGGSEIAIISVEQQELGRVGGIGDDCIPAVRSFDLDPSDVALLVADGVVNVEVQNSSAVDDFCEINRHTVRFTYEATVDPLEFGTAFVGGSMARSVVVGNPGTQLLELGLDTDVSEFSPSETNTSILPGSSAPITVVFSPTRAGPVSAALTLATNDPQTPTVTLQLAARGAEPPVAVIEPSSVEATLPVDGRESRTLQLSNAGASLLEFDVAVETPPTASFLSVTPRSGTIPPGQNLELTVLLDARSLLGGQFEAEVVLSTNDPLLPQIVVPVGLLVVGTPDIRITGESIVVESSRDFSGSGDLTVHLLPTPIPPAGEGSLELTAFGDFGAETETATVRAEGLHLGSVGGTERDCETARATFPIDIDGLVTVLGDGVAEIEVINAANVDPICPVNRHLLRLSYQSATEALDFGRRFVGVPATRSLTVENKGTDLLEVGSVSANRAPFKASPLSFSLPPGGLRQVEVEFAPQSAGEFAAVLSIASTDPDTPEARISLSGTGVDPPVIRVQPDSIVTTLPVGIAEVRGVSIGNDGGSPLEFAVTVTPVDLAALVRVEPASGSVPPSGAVALNARLLAGREPGALSGRIEIASNDPRLPVASVPIALTILSSPDIAILGEPVEIESTQDYQSFGDRTTHRFQIDVPPASDATLAVRADGEYGAVNETATVTAEGSTLGILGAVGADCVSVTETFVIGIENLRELVPDGVLLVDVQNGPDVEPVCSRNAHDLTLAYRGAADRLDFGETLIGREKELAVVVENRGSDPLVLQSVSSAHDAFSPSPPAASIPAGSGTRLAVRFQPTGVGPVSSTLSVASNDPDRPLVQLALTGWGLEPPRIEVAPASIDATLFGGERETVSLDVVNRGESSLRLSVRAGSATESPPFVAVEPPSATIPALGSTVVAVQLDASGLAAGVHLTELRVESNDPDSPSVVVPVGLTVLAAPNIEVRGERITAESELDFSEIGARTLHRFPIVTAPRGPGSLELSAEGDFGSVVETASVRVEGFGLGSVGGSGADCRAASGSLSIPGFLLSEVASDGLVEVEVQNSSNVELFCTDNRHRVRLGYRGPADPLDFGTLVLGEKSEIAIAVDNRGSEPLEVVSIVSDHADISARPDALTVEPGDSREVVLSFAPSAARSLEGTLRVHSNDPRTPVVGLGLRGIVLEPPRLIVDPESLQSTLHVGGRQARSLTLANSGGSPLEFSVTAELGDAASRVTPTPADGSIAPASELEVVVTIEGATVPESIEGLLRIASNDPAGPRQLPLGISVVGGPHLVLEETVTLESTRDFSGLAALTEHRLHLHRAPLTGGSVTVVADGDFGLALDRVTATIEGRVLGYVGGSGANCARIQSAFALDPAELVALAADGVVEIDLRNSYTVKPFCLTNRHTVQLSYPAEVERLDLGATFVGFSDQRSFVVRNAGTEPLEIGSILAEPEEFSVQPSSLTLAPGAVQSLTVGFAPSRAVPVSGRLVLASNDPDAPTVFVDLTGQGRTPSSIRVVPLAIAASVRQGQQVSRTLIISNDGEAPLRISIGVDLEDPGTSELAGSASPISLAGPLPASAGPRLFATGGTSGSLFSIDPPTAAAAFVGSLGLPALGLAVDPATNVLYAGRGDAESSLFSVDPKTGSTILIGPTGLEAGITALDFGPRGNLYAAVDLIDGRGTGGDSLAVIDTETGAGTIIGVFGAGIGFISGRHGIEALAFDPSGTLYAASEVMDSTSGMPMFYRIDTLTGRAIPIGAIVDGSGSPVPGGVSGLQFAPEGSLYGGTGHGTGKLIRIDPDTGIFTLIGSSLLSSVSALAPDLLDASSFVGLGPLTGSVPPGEAVEVELRLGGALVPDLYRAAIKIESDDPATPVVSVPVHLSVDGVPDIALPGAWVTLESRAEFFDSGDRTLHRFSLPVPAESGGRIELTIDGDFGSSTERTTLTAETEYVGALGRLGTDCASASTEFELAAATVDRVAADGVVEIEVRNSPAVAPGCDTNEHRVKLSYRVASRRLDFGQVFLGTDRTRALRVVNDGNGVLHVGSIATDTPEIAVDTEALTLPPQGSALLRVTYAPSGDAGLDTELRLVSDDPDEPTVAVRLQGTTLPPPAAGVRPESIEAALPPHDDRTKTKLLRIENDGLSDLVWAASILEALPEGAGASEWVESAKGDESDTGAGAVVADGFGGPDAFGYVFRDSDEVDGPVFEWVEISEVGTAIPLAGDDQTFGPVPIGFTFPFYGQLFDSVNVCSNGWLSFTSDKTSYSNPDSLPNAGFSVPANLIAPFWDDLHLRGVERVTYLDDGRRFVVQYTGVDRFSAAAELTFQVILYPSGRIVFQYLSMIGDLDSATIGIQDGLRSIGLLVNYNRRYVQDRFALELAPVPTWATIRPAVGLVPPGTFTDIAFEFSAAELPARDFQAVAVVGSNDPFNSSIVVPLTLHVGEVELEQFEILPRTLNLDSHGRWVRAKIQLPPSLDPRRVDLSTVTLFGELHPDASFVQYLNGTRDGIDELVLRFDRESFARLVPEGETVEVKIVGEVRDAVWFTGTTRLRLLRLPRDGSSAGRSPEELISPGRREGRRP
jgi:subtilisin family serine protease